MENTIVGLKELRENMGKYISLVKRGRSFVVVKRSRPLFRISSIDEDDGLWETVIDFTKLRKKGISAEELLSRL
ncbi:MAG: type II toxin-antitoxin system prevent-host-death family antitoxin [Candidatus Azambacteria bacterium]|nr:type II toxin-antitoxin system prevent-host-death family antitoxin [Candidatus Azambacteria bacterium]